MRKQFLYILCLVAMMAANLSLKAQEITITLNPGWNWISYPNTMAMDVSEAFGDFVPMVGDIVKSRLGSSTYINGQWRGGVTQFTPGWGYMYYSSRIETISFVFVQSTSSFVVTDIPANITATSAVVGGTVTIAEGNHIFARGVCWGTEPNPDIDGYHTTDATVIGSLTDTLTELTPNTTYYVRAYMVNEYGLAYGDAVSFTTESSTGDDHDYVDLGLPSGTLWATCNVGADTPIDYGDYFAWGETQPKDDYSWSTYQYCNDSYGNALTKYCTNSSYGYNGFTDNLTTLLPEDDAATANWGNDWRMPSKEEWQELRNNTTVIWTTQNGVRGRLFTAANGNSIFLAAAGFRTDDLHYYAGSFGDYWSSSLNTDVPDGAWGLDFGSGNEYNLSGYSRACGFTVRPVRDGVQNYAPTGSINGKFSINEDGGQVYFSQGNLQYQASTNTWRFADNQYDYVGSDNNNISSTYNGWIDLFGWGTSGYNHGAVCYQPWSTHMDNSGYYVYGDSQYNLYDQTGQADWGCNPISNGGNTANQWRTLTQSEWDYVFNTRSTASGIRYARANVNSVKGVILLPDDWNTSTYSLLYTNSSVASFSNNTLTASQWSTLEQAGAVFLPAAGNRNGTSLNSVGSIGNYWSASCIDNCYVYIVAFGSTGLYTVDGSTRYYGRSVRLVRNTE